MDNTAGKAALGGLDGNLAALLGYIIWVVALISLLMEKENRFVKFHAIQSLLLHASAIVVFHRPDDHSHDSGHRVSNGGPGSARWAAVARSIWLAVVGYIGALIYAAVKAYGGVEVELPIIGGMARKWAN